MIPIQKKKLLQINTVNNYSSTGRITEEIGLFAIGNGWDSYIAYGRYKRASKSNLIKVGSFWDIQLHGLITRLFDKHGLGSINSTKKLINQINNINPDIIHLHNLHGYYLNIELFFKYLATKNIPVILTLHDCWMMTGHCCYFESIGCDKWKTECNNCPQIKEYPSSLGFDRSKKNYYLKKMLFSMNNKLTIITVSEWLAGIVKQSYLADHPLKVIHNGIDINIFRPIQNSTLLNKYNLKNKFIILGVANDWGNRKGLMDFIKLSKSLDSNFQIFLVGLNSIQIKNLPSNIIGILRTDNVHELATLYSYADVYINPSAEETFGKTTIEAMACGTPVIVYNTTASPELVTKETGVIVEKGDIQGIINAIQIIKEKGKHRFLKACREHVLKWYNIKDRCMEQINLYDSILNQFTDQS